MATQPSTGTNGSSPPLGPDRRGLADLPQRVAVALPAAALALAAVAAGGVAFAALVVAAGALAAHEAFRLLVGGAKHRRLFGRGSAALLAGVWVGLPLALAVALRESDHGGALVLDVMLAVFVGDTAAHLLGSAFGRRPLAARISPRKTVEGLLAGITAGTVAVLVASFFQPWLTTREALVLGLAVSVAAPLGDLFESAAKRQAGVKDSGRMLGAHGGVLDRLDAVLFGVVAGYAVALVVV